MTRRVKTTKSLRYRFRRAEWKALDRLRANGFGPTKTEFHTSEPGPRRKAGYYRSSVKAWGRREPETILEEWLLAASLVALVALALVLAVVTRPEIRHLVWWQ